MAEFGLRVVFIPESRFLRMKEGVEQMRNPDLQNIEVPQILAKSTQIRRKTTT
ncbi:MAG: hypothetical protein AB7G13_11925 [Lautropia sp.]